MRECCDIDHACTTHAVFHKVPSHSTRLHACTVRLLNNLQAFVTSCVSVNINNAGSPVNGSLRAMEDITFAREGSIVMMKNVRGCVCESHSLPCIYVVISLAPVHSFFVLCRTSSRIDHSPGPTSTCDSAITHFIC